MYVERSKRTVVGLALAVAFFLNEMCEDEENRMKKLPSKDLGSLQ